MEWKGRDRPSIEGKTPVEWTFIIGEIAGSDHDNFLEIDLYEKRCVH